MRYLEVGEILTTHGINGEVKVKIETSNPINRFKKGNELYLLIGNNYQKITIDTFRMHKGMALISFNNITNINDVLAYVGKKIYVDKDSLPELDEDDFYYDDLIGMDAFDNNALIGVISDVLEVPQGAILVITKNDGKEGLVPFVSEFVKDVDLDNKKIYLELIEGLL